MLGTTEQNQPLKKFDLYIPKLKKGQFLVKIIYTGFCSSQYGEIIGVKGKDKYLPHCLGHEAVGKVLKKNSKKNFCRKLCSYALDEIIRT